KCCKTCKPAPRGGRLLSRPVTPPGGDRHTAPAPSAVQLLRPTSSLVAAAKPSHRATPLRHPM
ncbi:MAG TPA: hypothetical protein VIJ00_09675, partial [Nakamurella sp.]